MLTLRVIVIGLMALLPQENPFGLTAIAVKSAEETNDIVHKPFVLLLDGRCEAVSPSACIDPMIGIPTDGFNLAWGAQGQSITIRGDGNAMHFASGRTFGFEYMSRMPSSANEVGDLSWMFGLREVVEGGLISPAVTDGGGPFPAEFNRRRPVPGNAKASNRSSATATSTIKPYPDCYEGKPVNCPISSRFFLDSGTVSTCHLAHDLELRIPFPTEREDCSDLAARSRTEQPSFVRMYRLGNLFEQAFGNAVMIENRLPVASLSLTAYNNDDWKASNPTGNFKKEATLYPEEGVITVVYINGLTIPREFVASQLVAHLTAISPVPLSNPSTYRQLDPLWKLLADLHTSHPGHFEKLYRILEGSIMNHPLPELQEGEWSFVSPGACEPYLRCLDARLFWEPLSKSAQKSTVEMTIIPHSISECAEATYP